MPLSRELITIEEQFVTYETDLANVSAAINALPATPLEADLPDIVAIIASLRTITESLNASIKTLTGLIKTTRISQ